MGPEAQSGFSAGLSYLRLYLRSLELKFVEVNRGDCMGTHIVSRHFQASCSFMEAHTISQLFIEARGNVFGLIEAHGIIGFTYQSAWTSWNSQNRIKTTGHFPDVGRGSSISFPTELHVCQLG